MEWKTRIELVHVGFADRSVPISPLPRYFSSGTKGHKKSTSPILIRIALLSIEITGFDKRNIFNLLSSIFSSVITLYANFIGGPTWYRSTVFAFRERHNCHYTIGHQHSHHRHIVQYLGLHLHPYTDQDRYHQLQKLLRFHIPFRILRRILRNNIFAFTVLKDGPSSWLRSWHSKFKYMVENKILEYIKEWSGKRDSNSRSLDSKSSGLPDFPTPR